MVDNQFGQYPDGNPKTAFGFKKPALWYVPFSALFKVALAHLHGHLKYGHLNWREKPVSASIYIDACFRHLAAWKEGEENAMDSGIPHLAHAAACINIILDAQYYGTLIDDRHKCETNFEKLFLELQPIINNLYAEWGPDAQARKAQKNVDIDLAAALRKAVEKTDKVGEEGIKNG